MFVEIDGGDLHQKQAKAIHIFAVTTHQNAHPQPPQPKTQNSSSRNNPYFHAPTKYYMGKVRTKSTNGASPTKTHPVSANQIRQTQKGTQKRTFFSLYRARRETPETFTTLKRTPGISPTYDANIIGQHTDSSTRAQRESKTEKSTHSLALATETSNENFVLFINTLDRLETQNQHTKPIGNIRSPR